MKKVCDKKGFTLAELLIVMAIILILAAIAIPNFNKQLESARETSDVNALRASYSEAMTKYMLDKNGTGASGDIKIKMSQKFSQKDTTWEYVKTDGYPWGSLPTPVSGAEYATWNWTDSDTVTVTLTTS